MCGRYYRTSDEARLAAAFDAEPSAESLSYTPSYNIAPATIQPVVRYGKDTARKELVPMRWGMVGFGSTGPNPKQHTFNARSEALLSSALWRRPFHRQRCLVPADGFYEWDQTTYKPWRFTLRDNQLFAFAAIWDAWRHPESQEWLQSFAIITVPPNPTLAAIHTRMPAILQPKRLRGMARSQLGRRSAT